MDTRRTITIGMSITSTTMVGMMIMAAAGGGMRPRAVMRITMVSKMVVAVTRMANHRMASTVVTARLTMIAGEAAGHRGQTIPMANRGQAVTRADRGTGREPRSVV